MRGSDIIRKLGTDEVHDFIEREIFKIDPEHDYLILKGTESHPRVASIEHEDAIAKGRYVRLHIEGREIVSDVEWTTGHNAFEGNVEPKFTPARPKNYTVK
jgi:hypothetical protein